MIEIIYYSGCISCRKGKKWLDDSGREYKLYDIRDDSFDGEAFKKLYAKSHLSIDDFFNPSGARFKALGLGDKFSSMSEEEKINLLIEDKMLIKRPIIVGNYSSCVGFNEDKWLEVAKVRKEDRDVNEMPDECEKFTINMPLTKEQTTQIKLGFKPKVMEERWFIYSEGDDVYFHRSWRGNCIFIMSLEESGEHLVTANRNNEQNKSTDIAKDEESIKAILNRYCIK